MEKKKRGWVAVCGYLVLPVMILAVYFGFLWEKPDPYLYKTDKARLNTRDLAVQGAVSACYTGGEDRRIKVQITGEDGVNYNYDLDNGGAWERFTLTQGNGAYTVQVLENVEGTQYRPVLRYELTLDLADPYAPFRTTNQTVSFARSGGADTLAAELCRGLTGDAERIDEVFTYVTEHIAYDHDRAEQATPGYLPDVDDVLEQGKGICLDYAALMAAMLRSQNVPCRVVTGHAGEVFHAWVEVPDGLGGWSRRDPTFTASAQGDGEVLAFIQEDSNYKAEYYY